MKLKTISAISLTLASLNTFAYIASPGVKVELVKRYCTHPDRCGFVSRDDLAKIEMDKFNLKKNLMLGHPIITSGDYINTHAFCDNQSGHVNEYIKITSYHVINIQNQTKNIERFVVKYDLYTGEDEIFEERNITLNPGEYFHESYDSFENIIRQATGNYTIVATTSIDGDSRSLDLYSSDLSILP